MEYIENSKEIVGYRARLVELSAFEVAGFTKCVTSGGEQYGEVRSDGRWAELVATSSAPTWVLGLGDWDEQCPPNGQRYTICIERTPQVDLSALEAKYKLHRKTIGATAWMCFEVQQGQSIWTNEHEPYAMFRKLGWQWNANVGCHFDAHPPGHVAGGPPAPGGSSAIGRTSRFSTRLMPCASTTAPTGLPCRPRWHTSCGRF
jgi:hypothetical protein